MKITFDWLKDHLDTKLNEEKLLEQLTNVGLEVESVENLYEGLDLFKVAKIIKTEKHPNADRLKVCFTFDLIFFPFKFFNFPKPEAARSLAMPLTPKQSALFGVIDISITFKVFF